MRLIKVDFFWINRDQKSFEWFIQLLNQMEEEQAGDEVAHHKFLDLHMYLTAMKTSVLQSAINILHKKVSTLAFILFKWQWTLINLTTNTNMHHYGL